MLQRDATLYVAEALARMGELSAERDELDTEEAKIHEGLAIPAGMSVEGRIAVLLDEPEALAALLRLSERRDAWRAKVDAFESQATRQARALDVACHEQGINLDPRQIEASIENCAGMVH